MILHDERVCVACDSREQERSQNDDAESGCVGGEGPLVVCELWRRVMGDSAKVRQCSLLFCVMMFCASCARERFIVKKKSALGQTHFELRFRSLLVEIIRSLLAKQLTLRYISFKNATFFKS